MKLILLTAVIFVQVGHLVSATEKPNIILMMTDDHGWGDVGFNGNEVIITPNLDRVCRQGARLHYFFAAAPVCSPTRGSVLTGRFAPGQTWEVRQVSGGPTGEVHHKAGGNPGGRWNDAR